MNEKLWQCKLCAISLLPSLQNESKWVRVDRKKLNFNKSRNNQKKNIQYQRGNAAETVRWSRKLFSSFTSNGKSCWWIPSNCCELYSVSSHQFISSIQRISAVLLPLPDAVPFNILPGNFENNIFSPQRGKNNV